MGLSKIIYFGFNPDLAKEIADYMGISLADCSISRLLMARSISTYRKRYGHHVFVVQSTSRPVNEHYMELLIMIDALKRASARTINVIMPYYDILGGSKL